MITAEMAAALKTLTGHHNDARNGLADDEAMLSSVGDKMINSCLRMGLIADVTGGKDYPYYIITDTGRLRLEEYEGAQAVADTGKHVANDVAEFINLVRDVAIDVQISKYTHQQVGEQMNVIRDAADEFERNIQTANARIAELEALLRDAAQVIAPIREAVELGLDLMKARDSQNVYIRNSDGDEFIHIEADEYDVTVKHLRAVATFAAQLRAALDK